MDTAKDLNRAPIGAGDVVVVKLGGAVVEHDLPGLAESLATLATSRGCRLVLVHGGGKRVTETLRKGGVTTLFVDGLRVTTPEVLAVVESVLTCSGKEIASALTDAGLPAIGITGRDANALVGLLKSPELGRVGSLTFVDAALLRFLYFNGLTPVIAPIAKDDHGVLNVNADEVAAGVAAAVGAKHLLLLTDVDGVRDATGGVVPALTPADADALIRSGAASGGMIPKITGALAALAAGVTQVRVLSGADASALAALADGAEPGTLFVDAPAPGRASEAPA